MHTLPALTAVLSLLCPGAAPAEMPALFARGEGISLAQAVPANERGILALNVDDKGRVYGGTTGRAAHLFVYDSAKDTVRSLARLGGGVGFAYGLVRLPDGSLVGGTRADPTGTAARTDPKAVGRLYRFVPTEGGPARVEDLGVPVAGQGIYTLAYVEASGEVVGNTWPDGHFFSYDVKARRFRDHGAVAGHRTFETPQHAADVNRGTGRKEAYPRQVSRSIVVDPATGAYTGGADGRLYRYDPTAHALEKTDLRLPAAAGREPWASLDAAALLPRQGRDGAEYTSIVGGTSDGYLFELRIHGKGRAELRPWGKALAQGTVQGLVAGEAAGGVWGVGGGPEGMPRWFTFRAHGAAAGVYPGGIPRVDGQTSMSGFGALVADGAGHVYAGERDRIGRLVRYGAKPRAAGKPAPRPASPAAAAPAEAPPRLPCHVVFAPQGTTTDGSGYTAIEVGKDGRVYVGAARYGDYAWLLRFDPAARPTFLDKVVSLRRLTGERRRGIHTQGKIHSKLLVGADGRVWFATKQAHEIFDTRPEYGEDGAGFPGGHLCYYDPKTGFSRSLGILKRQEGLVGGALDDKRGRLYYRSEPKNHFLVYDIKTGEVRDRGHVGAACRYMAIDRRGAVWTVGRGNTLCRYDPETDYVEDVTVKLEGQGGYDSPYVLALGPNGKLYGAGTSHPWLLEYDIDTFRGGPFPEVTARNVAPAAPAGLPVLDVHAAVFGHDGKLYYPLNTSGPLEAGGKPQQHVRLMRFDPATRKSETVGVPRPVGLELEKIKHTFPRQDIFRVYYMQGAAVGPDGSLYLLGIYPQLHVVCFPKLTAPRRQKEKRHQALEIRSWQYPGFGDYWLLGPELVADKPGGVRLTHSVLLADETGATDFRQGEALGERVHAKKVFRLDSPDLTEAELLFYGSAKEVRANGTPLKKVGPLVSTGWSRVRVPVALLKQGANEFVFSGGGSLLLEPGRAPGHSFKSDDGGRTWSDRALGAKGDQQGEYLVRLRLGRYAPHGRATSRVLDLWAEAPGEIAAPGEVVAFRSPTSLNEGQPRGTRVVAWLRTGSTPVPDAEHWTAWRALDKELTPDAKGAGHRWAQLALELRTARPQASPALSTFHFDYVWRKGDPSPDREKFRVRRQPEETNPVRGLSPVPFVYQGPSPRLKLLRERYQLDKVIAPGRTEMERLMLLRYWVRNQWHTAWGSHPAAWMPPWDALVILESKDQPDCLTMCTHYACVFTQCCLALGWNARHCILDHHCVAEVWVDQYGKWVMMDAGNSARRADVGLHFERDGVPLSARELHLAYRDGKSDGLRVCFTPAKLAEQIAPLCRPAPQGKPAPRPDTIPLADLKGYPVCQLNNYRRYAFPARNDYLTSPLPGELYQGWSEYFYDSYWWVGDSPEYSRHLSPARPQDIDWDVNWCRLHLSHTDKPGELRVDVEAHVPNLARLERTAGDKEAWQATPAGFVWKLKPGENVLLVRGVNAWGRAGRAAAVAVEWKSAN